VFVSKTPKIFTAADLKKYSASRLVYCKQALSCTYCRRWESFSTGFSTDEMVSGHFFTTHQPLRKKPEVGRFFEVQQRNAKEIHDFWWRILPVSWLRHFVMQLPLPTFHKCSA
jgi:hypothetical protein